MTLKEIIAQEPHTNSGVDYYMSVLNAIKNEVNLGHAELVPIMIQGQERALYIAPVDLQPYLMDCVFTFLIDGNKQDGSYILQPVTVLRLQALGYSVVQDHSAVYVDLGVALV